MKICGLFVGMLYSLYVSDLTFMDPCIIIHTI
jgi:hypothetical protein